MPTHLSLLVAVLALAATGTALAQNKVRTETIRPSPPGQQQGQTFKPDGHVGKPDAKAAGIPEIVDDPARLPPAVAATRDRILAAARSGDPEKLLAVMKSSAALPVFAFDQDQDPVGFWKQTFPDSGGVEALAILINILETPYVHVDVGSAQEIYLWPYFARMPLKALTAKQKVELFRIVTGADYKDMIEFGAYSFYRLGIAPDGTWHFFVSGD
jgi:hypothetical protein